MGRCGGAAAGIQQLLVLVELLEADFVVHNCVEKDALLPLDRAAPLELSLDHGDQLRVDLDSRLCNGHGVEMRVQFCA